MPESDEEIAAYLKSSDSSPSPVGVVSTAKLPPDEEIAAYLKSSDTKPAAAVDDSEIAQFLKEQDARRFPQGGTEAPNAKKLGTLAAMGELGAKIPRPTAQQIAEIPRILTPNLTSEEILHQSPAAPGTASKIAAGALEASNRALGFVATLGPVLGAVSKLSPLIGRAISVGTAVDIGAHLPEMYGAIQKSAEEGDEEGVARGVTELGLGAFFAVQSARHGLGPGAAAESPLLAKVLTRAVNSKIAPAELREIFERVKAGEGTPAEEELVKFMASNPGVTEVSEVQPRFNSERFNRYMGLTKGKVNLSQAPRTEEQSAKEPAQLDELGDQASQVGDPRSPLAQSEVLDGVAVATKGDQVSRGMAGLSSLDVVNHKSGDIVNPALFTSQTTGAINSGSEAPDQIIISPGQGDKNLSASVSAESTGSFSVSASRRDALAAQLTNLPKEAISRAIVLLPSEGAGPEGSTASFAYFFHDGVLVKAFPRAINLPIDSPMIVPVGFLSASLTDIHGALKKVPNIDGVYNAFAPDAEAKPPVKEHVTVDGLDVTIENPKGSTRTGTEANGQQWSVVMPASYGFFKRTRGKDSDPVDVYLGPDTSNGKVFVVDQLNAETGQHDEHKILYGFPDQQTAVETYDAAFSDGKGPQRRGAITELSKAQFKDWLQNGDKELPVARPPDLSEKQPSISDRTETQNVGESPAATVNRGAMTPEVVGQMPQTTEAQLATGVREIVDLLPQTGLPKEAVDLATALLSQPVFQKLDLSKLQIEVKNQVRSGNVPVAGTILGNLVEISRTSADARTIPHELFHLLYDLLTPEDQALVEQWRRKEIEQKYGEDAPAALIAGTMTSEQALNGGMPVEDYHLINASEYLAHMGSEQFERENQPDAKAKSFLDRLRDWIRGLIETVRRLFKLDPTADEMVRDILAGHRVTTPESGKAYEQRASYSKSSKDAVNAEKLASSAEARRIEGEHQLAQASDIVRAIEKHGGASLSSGAARILRYGEFVGIQAAGERLLGAPSDYRALKASSPDQTTWRARLAATQWHDFRAVLDRAISERDKMLPKMTSPSFLKTLAREAAAKARFTTAEQNVKIMKAMFDVAIRKARKAMKFEAKSEREIESTMGQIREIEEAMASSTAMTQLTEDMVRVLSSTNEGVLLLFDPNFGTRTDIINVYRDLKISAGQPLHSPTLIKWAAYLLQKSKRVRENLIAQLLSSTAPGRAAMNVYEKQLTDQLQVNPVKTIKDILRGGGKMATERERAAFVWRTLHKKVVERLEEFGTLDDAAKVAEGIRSDPDVKALVTEINHDAGWISGQKPFEVFQDRTIVLPDKSEVSLGADYFVGSNAEFVHQRAKVETAITTLKSWLANPANADDVDFGAHQRNAETLEDYFTGMAMLQPSDPVKVFNATFGILHNSADLIGGRIAVGLRKSIRKYEVIHSQSAQWMHKWSYKLTASRVEAMKSHDMKWGSMGEVSLSEANKVWWDRVGNLLTFSFNRQEGGIPVGEVLPTGWTVTAQDVRAVQMMSQAAEEAYGMVNRVLSRADAPYVVDTIGEHAFYRTPLKGAKWMTPRTFNKKMTEIGRRIADAFTKYQDATKAGSVPAAGAALDEIVRVLDQNWATLGPGLVLDRNADFARETIFDGPGGALSFLAPDVYKFHSATDFFQEIENLTGTPSDKVKEILALEWARPIQGWYNEVRQEPTTSVARADEQGNAFTRSRNQAFAPFTFYEYGFRDSASMASFGSGMQSRAMDELVSAFRVAKLDVERQIGEFQSAAQQLRAAGRRGAEKAARSAMDIERANGRNFDNYQLLQKRLKETDRVINALVGHESTDPDVISGRLIGLVTGSLIGMYTTARNITDGPRYLGQVANRLMASNLAAYPVAFFYGIVRAQIPFLVSAGASTAKSVLYKLPIEGPMVALYRFITQPDRSSRKFMLDLMEPFLKEIGEDLYNRIKVVDQMVKDGLLDAPNSVETELNARLLGSLLSGGQLLDAELSLGQKLALAPISLAELLFLNASQKVNPKFGDYSLNSAVYMLMKSGVGPMKYHEDRWRQVAAQVRSGARAWDTSTPDNPVNRLTHQEVFPALSGMRLSSNEGDLMFAREVFSKAGLDYDQVAFDFINGLLNGQKPAAFTPEQSTALIDAAINMTNRATGANTPQFAKSRSAIARWLSPFWNWTTRMLSNFLNLMAVPAQVGRKISNMSDLRKARARQWAYMAMTVLLPALVLGALVGVASNEEGRAIKKLVYNQVMAYRQPWEREGGKSQAIGWAVEGMNNIPIVGGLLSMAINDIPVRATMDPNFVMLSKIKDVANYVGGVMQTGDFGYKLPELAIGLVPDSRIILSRLPFYEGRQELNNAASVLRRYGPMDSMRPMGGARGGVVATELTPYGDRMANAAISGDMESFQRIYQEAVDKAREIGKEDPDRAVREMFRSRNPYDRVFKSKLSPSEREQILQSATPAERALVESVEQKFSAAAALIGARATFAADESPRGGGKAGGGLPGLAGTANYNPLSTGGTEASGGTSSPISSDGRSARSNFGRRLSVGGRRRGISRRVPRTSLKSALRVRAPKSKGVARRVGKRTGRRKVSLSLTR